MKRRLKVNGVIICAAVLLLVFLPTVFLRHKQPGNLDLVLEALGVSLILSGQVLRTSARGFKSEHSQEGQRLIQGGPYALVRNPMYLGILLIGLGVVALLFKWWVAGIFLGIFLARYILLIFSEEKKLLGLFGQTYQDYRRHVPSLLPSMRAFSKRNILEYLPLKASWLKREIGSMLALLLPAIFLAAWTDMYSLGLNLYLKRAIVILAVIILFLSLIFYLIRKEGA